MITKAETQRTKDIARAALLRERVLGALRASPDFMTLRQLCDWPSVAELYHGDMLPAKIGAQLRQLLKAALVERNGRAAYRAVRRQMPPAPPPQPESLQHLRLEVHKASKTISFVFEGLQISVRVI